MKKLTVTQIKHLLGRAEQLLDTAHRDAVASWMESNPEPEISEDPQYIGVPEIHADVSLLKLKSPAQLRRTLIDHIQNISERQLNDSYCRGRHSTINISELIEQPKAVTDAIKKYNATKKANTKWAEVKDKYVTSLRIKRREMITDLTDRLYLCNSEEAMDQLEALKTFKF